MASFLRHGLCRNMALTDAKDLTAAHADSSLPAARCGRGCRASTLPRSAWPAAAFIIRVSRRGGDLPVADPAGALDGRRRVRHLHLCLDLAADDRRHRPSRLAAHRAAYHSRIHPAQRPRPAARLPDRQPLDRLRARRLWSRCSAHSRCMRSTPALDRGTIMPLYLACVALPLYPVSNMLDGLARSYDAVNIALLPPFVLRPLTLIAVMARLLCGRHRARRDHGDGGVRVRHLDDDAVAARPVQPLPRQPGAGRAAALRCQRMDQDVAARSSRCGPSTCC